MNDAKLTAAAQANPDAVEAVARAICDSAEADDFATLPSNSVYRALYLQQATAAIEAMEAARQSPHPEGDEVAWLIEIPKQRRYWSRAESVNPPRHLTEDPNLAVRFARKIDAEAVIARQELDAIATEHMWCAP